MNDVELAYLINDVCNQKQSVRLLSSNNNIDIICLISKNGSYLKTADNKKGISIDENTNIEDIVDFCYSVFQEKNIQDINIEMKNINSIIIENIENNIVQLEIDDIYIDVLDDYFEPGICISDVLNLNLTVNKKATNVKKANIQERFNNLLK